MLSILQQATPAHVSTDPFPHIVIEDALPEDLYADLARAFPHDEIVRRGKALRDKGKFSYDASRVLASEEIDIRWRDFMAYHTSQQFFCEVISLFGDHIRRLHPGLEARLGKSLIIHHDTPAR